MFFDFSDLEKEKKTDMTRKIFWEISFFYFKTAKVLNILRSLELQILLAKKKLVK